MPLSLNYIAYSIIAAYAAFYMRFYCFAPLLVLCVLMTEGVHFCGHVLLLCYDFSLFVSQLSGGVSFCGHGLLLCYTYLHSLYSSCLAGVRFCGQLV